MNYLHDRRSQRKKYLKIFYIVVVILALFYFRSHIFRGFSSVTGFIFRPVLSAGNGAGSAFSNVFSYFESKNYLVKENEDLRNTIEKSAEDRANYSSVVAENESLKEVLGRKGENSKMTLGVILAKPNQSLYGTLVIDVGNNLNIKTGDKVFAMGDIPIGYVSEVNSNTSKVTLFTYPGEKTQTIVGTKGVYIELIGRGGGNFEMSVPNDFEVEIGGQAVLPGIKPYVVATIEKVISDPRDALQKVLLISPVNIQELKFVEVLGS